METDELGARLIDCRFGAPGGAELAAGDRQTNKLVHLDWRA